MEEEEEDEELRNTVIEDLTKVNTERGDMPSSPGKRGRKEGRKAALFFPSFLQQIRSANNFLENICF